MTLTGIKKTHGFTLLMAIVVVSMLLLVSFVVANIALKQLVLAYSGQESQYSFYNADSGVECALYNDLKKSPSAFDPVTPGQVDCNSQAITTGSEAAMDTIPSQASYVGGGGSGGGPLTNYAPAGTAAAVPSSNEYSALYPASSVTTANQSGSGWGSGGGWNNQTAGLFPNIIELTLAGSKTLNEIDVYTLPDGSPVNPVTATTPAINDGIADFLVEYFDGSWKTVPGGSVVGNTLAWTKLSGFSLANVSKIRVTVTKNHTANGDYSRIVRLEAWGGGAASGPPSIFQLNFTHGCAIVTVTKSGASTLIESRGYNTCVTTSDRRFERGIKISY